MKHKSLLLIALLLLATTPIYANSAPVYWTGYPASEMLSIDQDSPLAVTAEHLTFDIFDTADTTLSGTVTAEYTMTNPTDAEQAVTMLFPFIDRLDTLDADAITITSDGADVPYTIMVDYRTVDDNQFSDIAGFVSTSLAGASFDLAAAAKLYTIKVVSADRMYLMITADYASDDTLIIGSDNLGGYDYDGAQEHTVRGWVDDEETIELLVIGDDVDLQIAGYTDYEADESYDDFSYTIDTAAVIPTDYLTSYLRNTITNTALTAIDDIQLANLCIYYLTSDDSGFIRIDEFSYYADNERMIGLYYTVDFQPGETKTITVGYLIQGTMDRRETASPTYQFDYLLRPARYWASFSDLTIDVLTPDKAAYIIDSTIEFSLIAANHYQAVSAVLPDEDLSFTLYETAGITTIDRVEGWFNNLGYILPLSGLAAGAVLMVSLITLLIRYLHKHRK